jgi:hypothetical protein
MRIVTLIVAVVGLVVIVPVSGEEMPSKPMPTAEHERLEEWVGEWVGKGELEESPFGPGGPMEWTETCEWFGDAKFHVVCRSEGTGPMGEMQGLGIMGYDPAREVYTHYGIDTTGWTGHSTGTREGSKYTFHSEETVDDETFHSRFTMTKVSEREYEFSWSMSQDGENWRQMMSGTTKKK